MRSLRVPDPTTEIKTTEALTRLLKALEAEDNEVAAVDDPLRAAVEHLARCGPVLKKSVDQSVCIGLPASGKRCCGLAFVLYYLAREHSTNPVVRSLHAAVVKAKPLLQLVDELIDEPSDAMLNELRHQTDRTTVLRRHPLRQGVERLKRAIDNVNAARDSLEERLAQEFGLAELHSPVAGRGRPHQGLKRELSRVLRATGHTVNEIARLLPDGSGEIGAAKRARENVRGRRDRPKKTP